MDGEVPEYLAAGVSRDRALDDYYLTHELRELLHPADAGAGSSLLHVAEKPSQNFLPSPSTPTCYGASDESSARAVASEAEMASWLSQIFEQNASHLHDHPSANTTSPTKSAGESTVDIRSDATGNRRAASAGTRADQRPRSGGRRRSSSGKAAEQRRRDKINDRMRTLQQLMPRCSKTDKASTLEEVIQYVKSLQHQLQMLQSASGYAMPTAAAILPPGVVPPSCMQLATRPDVLTGQAPPPVMLPLYPFVPAVFSCPHHVHGTPPPPTYRYPPVGSASATQQQFVQSRHSNDLAVPTHSMQDKPQMTCSVR